MEQPDTEVLYAEALDDGTRIFTSQDAVYEARQADGFEHRVYQEDGDWTATVRFDDTKEEAAYERWKDMAQRLEASYDADVEVDPVPFHETVTEDSHVSETDRGVTLRYNESGVPVEPDDGQAITRAWLSYIAGGAGAGGAAAAATTGVPEAAAAGALLGGFSGAIGFFPSEVILHKTWKKASPLNYIYTRAENRAEEEQGYAGKLLNPEFLDDVNTKRSIAARMNEEQTLEGKDEYDRLQDEDLDAELETVMDAAFRKFDEWEGVTVTTTAPTYDAATTFIEDVTGTDQPDHERPSMYTDRDTLAAILNHLPPSDVAVVVRNAVDRDVSEDAQDFLEDEYAEAVTAAGREHALERLD